MDEKTNTTDPPVKPPRRWLRLTPDRLVVGLLGWVGFLFLSEQFRWFAFNEKKGWTVLIAVASVGVALLLMALWFAASLMFHWRFQFSIRSLLVLVVVVAIPASWLAVEMRRADKQRRAVAAIEMLEGVAKYDYEYDSSDQQGDQPPEPVWLRKLLGDEFFTNVSTVGFSQYSRMTDADLKNLEEFTRIQGLFLNVFNITDAGLVNLKGLINLQELQLGNTQVTDAGLVNLKGLTQLTVLHLDSTRVTDAGLEHLKGMTQLKGLWLDWTSVTDAGLESLKGFTQLNAVSLCNTKVTDAGLDYLRGMTHLDDLWLGGTAVTDAGVAKLQSALPNCHIER